MFLMTRAISLFKSAQPVVAMIHAGALPGTPASRHNLRDIVAQAEREARLYRDAGVDGLLIENMHDTPYMRGQVGPEIVAAMTVVVAAVKKAASLPTGLQILAAANREALAVAHATGLDFIRAEGFVFAHVADEGIIQSCAAELLRYRRAIGAEHIQIWADVKKKHSAHAVTADVSIGETAYAVEFMRAMLSSSPGPSRATRRESVILKPPKRRHAWRFFWAQESLRKMLRSSARRRTASSWDRTLRLVGIGRAQWTDVECAVFYERRGRCGSLLQWVSKVFFTLILGMSQTCTHRLGGPE